LLTRYIAPSGADACLLIVKPTAFTIEREKQGEVVFLISFVGSLAKAGDEIAIQKLPLEAAKRLPQKWGDLVPIIRLRKGKWLSH